MRWSRSSGVLLPAASLPSGRVGDDGRRFLDWLAAAGQRWWQVLPLGPPDRYGSPYASSSAFAASPALLAHPTRRVGVDDVERFVAANASWIADWAAATGPGAIADQVRFEREWAAVRAHVGDLGIRILGDLAFSVAWDSVDHDVHPELFRPGLVGGVPPDDWSASGQLWGTPVFDWRRLAADGFGWWIERFRRSLDLFDAVRIDHFRGFVASWQVPASHRTARRGRWVRGPGRAVFDAVQAELGAVPLVAENLGLITPAVERLRHSLGAPGTVVLQFEFADGLVNRALPAAEDDVVYTGTHDNDTSAGWWAAASDREREHVRRRLAALGVAEAEPSWMLVHLAMRSPAQIAIVPAQDLLGLGSEARTNRPGRARGNWAWRLPHGALDARLARRLRDATEAGARA